MSKSILIIDTPRDCFSCMFRDADLRRYCVRCEITGAKFTNDFIHEIGRPHELPFGNCPLKFLPPKRIVCNHDTNYAEEPWFSDGWNACVDYLEGDGDGS